jgi:hypothetical protein
LVAPSTLRREGAWRIGRVRPRGPPIAYRTDGAISTVAIVSAQTILHGASSRVAATSVPRLATPTTNTIARTATIDGQDDAGPGGAGSEAARPRSVWLTLTGSVWIRASHGRYITGRAARARRFEGGGGARPGSWQVPVSPAGRPLANRRS